MAHGGSGAPGLDRAAGKSGECRRWAIAWGAKRKSSGTILWEKGREPCWLFHTRLHGHARVCAWHLLLSPPFPPFHPPLLSPPFPPFPSTPPLPSFFTLPIHGHPHDLTPTHECMHACARAHTCTHTYACICRRDADERPELCCGSVEYVATQDYCVRPPMAPTHFFLIDVSQTAIATGATATTCSCISLVLDDIPRE